MHRLDCGTRGASQPRVLPSPHPRIRALEPPCSRGSSPLRVARIPGGYERLTVNWCDLSFAEFGSPGRPFTAPADGDETMDGANSAEYMARREGFEPPTLRFEETF